MPEWHSTFVVGGGDLAAAVTEFFAGIGVDIQPIETLTLKAQLEPAAGGTHVVVVHAPDDDFPSRAEALERLCWSEGWCLSHAHMDGHLFQIGPIVAKGLTPCMQCFRSRRRSWQLDTALELEALLARSESGARKGRPLGPILFSLTRQVAALVVAETISFVNHPRTDRYGKVIIGDAIEGRLSVHRYPAIGLCVECSQPTRNSTHLVMELRGGLSQ